MGEQIWFKSPSVLFDRDTWSRFVPTKEMTTSEALNSVVRFATYFAVILYFASGNGSYLMAIPVVMATTILLQNLFPNGKTIESFITKEVTKKDAYTMPSNANPFMNVLLTEIVDNPNRSDAAPTNRRDVKTEIHKSFQKTSDIYMDTTDLFDQTHAMRTFHTLQSSTVPNDLDGFKKWLSKDLNAPDHSSAPPSRGGKVLSEGHVSARGSMRLPSSIDKPSGATPSGPLPAKRSSK